MKDSELIQKVHSGNKEAVGIIIEQILCRYLSLLSIYGSNRG